jgi:ADP-ribose pyrophosphatase YjhB (NUDIX family)
MARFPYRSASHLFLIRDGAILLSRRANTGFMDGSYSVPAGHIEEGETAREALSREAREEIGLEIPPGRQSVAHVMHRNAEPGVIYIDFFMTADSYSGELRNLEPDKCDDLSWHPLDALPENTIPYIRQAIEAVGRGEQYSEFGWGRS